MWKKPAELPTEKLKDKNDEIYVIGLCDDGPHDPLCPYNIYFDGVDYWYPFTGNKATKLVYWTEYPSASAGNGA